MDDSLAIRSVRCISKIGEFHAEFNVFESDLMHVPFRLTIACHCCHSLTFMCIYMHIFDFFIEMWYKNCTKPPKYTYFSGVCCPSIWGYITSVRNGGEVLWRIEGLLLSGFFWCLLCKHLLWVGSFVLNLTITQKVTELPIAMKSQNAHFLFVYPWMHFLNQAWGVFFFFTAQRPLSHFSFLFQGCSEVARSMEYPSFDIVANLPEIDAFMRKLQGISF